MAEESFGRLVIRADADVRMGTGHLMRCLALGQAWKERGGQATFWSRLEIPALRQRLDQEWFEFIELSRSYPEPEDLQRTLDYLAARPNAAGSGPGRADWLVLDGYHFTLNFQQAVRRSGFKLLVIDDYRSLPRYEADILLNQNIYAGDLDYCCNDDAVKLLGCNYALLRREFCPYLGLVKEIPERARKILVTMGGGDPDNVTLKVIKAIKQLNEPGLEVSIVVGPANPFKESLQEELSGARFAHRLLVDVSNLPVLKSWADLTVSAGGSTCWELCFMGVPSLIIVAADNQRGIGAGLEEAGVARCLGWHEATSPDSISGELEKLLQDKTRRAAMSARGRELVDGKGVKRVLRAMLFGQIRLRPVAETDSRLLWQWANDPVVRRFSFNRDPIDWQSHIRWLAVKLGDERCRHYIAMGDCDIPFGQIRFDIMDNARAEINYSIDQRFRGLGLGHALVIKGMERLEADLARPLTFQAKVKAENIVSSRIFRNAGFSSSSGDACIVYRKEIALPETAEI